MTTEPDLQARLRQLEDVEAIRRLKARYLACCDNKDPRGMRDCFVDGPVDIDYGAVGRFDHRDALAALFERLACHPHIVEMHHGVNPHITVIDAQHAHGTWGLHYQQIDTQTAQLTQLGATYEDRYRRHNGEWKISATRCVVNSTLVLDLGDSAAVKVLFRGAPVATA